MAMAPTGAERGAGRSRIAGAIFRTNALCLALLAAALLQGSEATRQMKEVPGPLRLKGLRSRLAELKNKHLKELQLGQGIDGQRDWQVLQEEGASVGVEPDEKATAAYAPMSVVFSTECNSSAADWMSVALAASHLELGLPGNVSRVFTCDNAAWPSISVPHPRYTELRIPSAPGAETYSPRNKPFAMLKWLEHYNPPDDHVVVMADPDMWLLQQPDTDGLRPGLMKAAIYGLGEGWYDAWGHIACGPDCPPSAEKLRQSCVQTIGHPVAMLAGDLRKIAPWWLDYIDIIKNHTDPQVQKVSGSWMVEMHAMNLAVVRQGIDVECQKSMITHASRQMQGPATGWEEDWDLASWDTPPAKQPLYALHYCQWYEIGNYRWSKHRYGTFGMQNFPIKDCAEQGKQFLFEEVAGADAERYRSLLGKQIGFFLAGPTQAPEVAEEVEAARHAWIYNHTAPRINTALQRYYEHVGCGNFPIEYVRGNI